MELEIRCAHAKINVLSAEFTPPSDPEVFINGERCPKAIEDIILKGLGVLAGEYINDVFGGTDGVAHAPKPERSSPRAD